MSYTPGDTWAKKEEKTKVVNKDDKDKATTIQEFIRKKMKTTKMKQCEVAEMAHMSEYKLSRILHNSNGHGGAFQWDEKTVYAVAIAMHCSSDDVTKMLNLAFPGRELWDQAITNRDTLDTLNVLLAKDGYPLF